MEIGLVYLYRPQAVRMCMTHSVRWYIRASSISYGNVKPFSLEIAFDVVRSFPSNQAGKCSNAGMLLENVFFEAVVTAVTVCDFCFYASRTS